jgi:Rieske Fe-S protein
MNNTTGGSNTATGWEALIANTTGNNNTAIGNQALQSSVTTSDHVALGTMAGSGITTADNNIIIGHNSGVHSVFGEESDRCFIDNIHGAPVSAATATIVMVDSDGRLGTTTADGPALGGFSPKGTRPQAIPDAAKQTMLDLKVQNLRATATQQQQQIQTFTAQVKEQAAQIQKVNAQLEMRKPAAKVIANKP